MVGTDEVIRNAQQLNDWLTSINLGQYADLFVRVSRRRPPLGWVALQGGGGAGGEPGTTRKKMHESVLAASKTCVLAQCLQKDIQVAKLPALTERELVDIGVAKLLHRNRFLR